uniref:Uncharacterized protein n=1 Tax=Anguilla anguilla TaxID=7936 RepID=A0A0E9QKW0_ANGAN
MVDLNTAVAAKRLCGIINRDKGRRLELQPPVPQANKPPTPRMQLFCSPLPTACEI